MDTAAADRRRFLGWSGWSAALLLAGVSVIVGCRVADTDAITPVPQLLAFLPWLLVPAGLGLACAAFARWWSGTVWGVALLGLLAWFIEPYGTTGTPEGPAVASFRVLTANVEFGQATDELVAAVRRERPHVVFVPECEYVCAARLRKELGADYPHRAARTAGGPEGSAILSRFPLRPADGVPGTPAMPGAVADVDGHPVRLQLAHPMPPLPGQVGVWRRELGALRDFAAADEGTPTVLAGDLGVPPTPFRQWGSLPGPRRLPPRPRRGSARRGPADRRRPHADLAGPHRAGARHADRPRAGVRGVLRADRPLPRPRRHRPPGAPGGPHAARNLSGPGGRAGNCATGHGGAADG